MGPKRHPTNQQTTSRAQGGPEDGPRRTQGGHKDGPRRARGGSKERSCTPAAPLEKDNSKMGHIRGPRGVCPQKHEFYNGFRTQIKVMRGLSGDTCWSLDPYGGNLGALWAHLGVTRGTFGPIWGSYEPSGKSSGDMWGASRAIRAPMCSKPLVL